jgi:Rv2525c-like, glycoside hydrolase-like domain
MLVQPAASRPGSQAAAYPVDRLITETARRIMVTVTYRTDRALITRILASAALPAAARRPGVSSAPADMPGDLAAGPAARAGLPRSATDYTGQGFDACTAPSVAQMQAWRQQSPYRAIGIYIGGSDRACAQPNLTASWVSRQQQAGWHFIPIYVGPQAGFGEISSAASQAVSAVRPPPVV